MAKKKRLERTYTLSEAAEAVDVNPRTITRWIGNGKVAITPLRDYRGHYHFTQQQVDELIEFKHTLKPDDRNTE